MTELETNELNIDRLMKELEEEDDNPGDYSVKEKSTRKQKVKTILREYAQLASMHAIDHIGEAHGVKVIMFWTFILLICAGTFGWLLNNTLTQFLLFEVTVDIAIAQQFSKWKKSEEGISQFSQMAQQVQIPMTSQDERMMISYGDKRDWLQLFRQMDRDGDGFIPMPELKGRIETAGDASSLTPEQRQRLLFDADKNRDKMVDFGEFCFLMSRAKQMKMQKVVFRAAQLVVPKNNREEKFSYLQQYSCCPPPIFLLLLTIVEVAVYVYYVVDMNAGISVSGPVPRDSPLIYNPCKREEAWRYLTYMFIHIGIYHILFNSLTQLVLGIPLELVHTWRVGVVYLLGVISGSLAVSVTDPLVYLAGASGGVYALISAHVANLVVNWDEMEFAIFRLIFIVLLVGSDVGVALYNRYGNTGKPESKVSYVAHIGGFVAGLLMGIVVLRNFKKKTWERVVWWIALVGFIVLILLCVAWNIFYPQYPTDTDWPCNI